MKKKVIIAMSGGVDSSVSAALLKEKGYDVVGITMQVWPSHKESGNNGFGGCCSVETIEDARKVADKLGIPHYVLNFRDVFQEKVIDNFVEEYQKGRTPNPCIRCNQYIKFEALMNKAIALEASYLATGHYARISYDPAKQSYLLGRGIDSEKDQSYFLYAMTQEQMKRTLLPLGGHTKEQTRNIARKLALKVADKPESQEICFIPDNDYHRFLDDKKIKAEEGPVYDPGGNQIGTHRGVIYYTIGQRRGLGMSSAEPLYVLEIDKNKNSLTIGENKHLYKNGLIAGPPNLIGIDNIDEVKNIDVQIRYNMKPAKAHLSSHGKGLKVEFDKPQTAVTPGQSAVFYDGKRVIGGALIEKAI